MLNKRCISIALMFLTLFILHAQTPITIGEGANANSTTGVPTPYGTYYKNFRQQYLYRASELITAGGTPGTITGIAFNVSNVNNCVAMPNYRIRLKSTEQSNLTSTFETGEYTQVWHSDSFLPSTGWNTHNFSTPFVWDGSSNIIVDIVTDLIDGQYTQNASVYYSGAGFTSSLRYRSDSSPAINATTGTTSSNRSNTLFLITTPNMGSLSGSVTENGLPLPNVTINIENTVYSTLTDASGAYDFPYAPPGTHTVTASKPGYTPVSHNVTIVVDEETVQDFLMIGTPELVIDPDAWSFGDVNLGGSASKLFTISNIGGGSLGISSINITGSATMVLNNVPTMPVTLTNEQSLSFTVNFSPTVLGEFNATVSIVEDQGRSTFVRETHSIALSGNGVNDITIGDGSSTGRFPMDFYWKNSLFETIYTADEMNNFIGMITGVKFYNQFVTDLPNMPTKVWLGSTTQSDLAAGWIPSSELTLVFDGTVNYPSGENVIAITFPEPFMHLDGGNLVMMVQRPMDTQYYSSSDVFKTQTAGTNRSRNIQSDSTEYDPAAPAGGTLSGNFPKTTFTVIPGGVGDIIGIVTDPSNQPLAGVEVRLNEGTSTHITGADGAFAFVNLLPDTYHLSFGKHGYLAQTQDVQLEEDQIYDMEITLVPMASVGVSGTLIASDNLQGIEGATITMSGYEDYSTQSVTDGSFLFPAVYAMQSYQYHISHPGYSSLSGTIQVQSASYAFGTMQMNELAFAPHTVTAELTPGQNSINIAWQSPNPDAIGLEESFEGEAFPPQDWSQIITNAGAALSNGAFPTWHRNAEIISGSTIVTPTDGSYQAGLWWDYGHQDEWLISASFNCPSDAVLSFDSRVFLGSTEGDSYSVKLSTDDGESWSTLWDASQQSGGWNHYEAPIVIELSAFTGRQIRLAYHANDNEANEGLYYDWFIDNVQVLSSFRQAQRGLEGYDLWRFPVSQLHNPPAWTQVNAQTVEGNSFIDNGWAGLAQGDYAWAVKARYSNDVLSSAAISNPLSKSGGIPAAPQNLQISVVGEDVHLNWDAVTTDTSGNPLEVALYELHVLASPDEEPSVFSILDITPETSYYIPEVTPYVDQIFFCVKARVEDRADPVPAKQNLLRIDAQQGAARK
jgi:hypothetical protein